MSRNFRIYWRLPLLLYAVTWLTTTGFRFDFDNGVIHQFFLSLMLSLSGSDLSGEAWWDFGQQFYHGILFSVPLMLILTCHELGHFIQMRRYGVHSSLPYFIPMPIGPFGTLGAVIAMDGHIPNARALFDIGISGPIAGLIPTLFCLYFGIKWSYFIPVSAVSGDLMFGNPLLFQSLIYWIFGPMPSDVVLYFHPVALAGWVGLFLTSLNLMPFGQLDGGHVFYALLGRRATAISWCVFYTVIILVIWFRLWHWSLILILLAWIGITHPPTANENVRLTPFRRILGWGILAFIVFGITPTPIIINDPPQTTDPPRIYCRIDIRSIRPFR